MTLVKPLSVDIKKRKTLLDFHSFRATIIIIFRRKSNVTSSIIIETQHVILKLSSFFLFSVRGWNKCKWMANEFLTSSFHTSYIQTTTVWERASDERTRASMWMSRVEKKLGLNENVKQEKGFIAPFVCYAFLLIHSTLLFSKFPHYTFSQIGWV